MTDPSILGDVPAGMHTLTYFGLHLPATLFADPATRAEREVLGAFRYTSSRVLLHTGTPLLPRAPAARASWNYLLPACQGPAGQVTVSYHLNRLMGLAEDYRLPARATAAFKVIGDGVAVPVVRFLARELLEPLLEARRGGAIRFRGG